MFLSKLCAFTLIIVPSPCFYAEPKISIEICEHVAHYLHSQGVLVITTEVYNKRELPIANQCAWPKLQLMPDL